MTIGDFDLTADPESFTSTTEKILWAKTKYSIHPVQHDIRFHRPIDFQPGLIDVAVKVGPFTANHHSKKSA